MIRLPLVASLLLCAVGADAQITLTRGTNFALDVAADGRLSFDLHGKIWLIPAGGGVAEALPGTPPAARRPQFSPDASAVVFQGREHGQERLYLYRNGAGAAQQISVGDYHDHHPSWHPDGERIVYSSDRRATGLDLWELDLATGLTWRLSNLPGDETEPRWSADGEDLIYVHRNADLWSLMLRRRGRPDRVLEASTQRLSSPSWRPDGSLVTVLRHGDEALSIDMIILSDPILVRPLIEDEDIFIAPVAWRDRQHLVYAANGQIRSRAFNSRNSRRVPFRAAVYPTKPREPRHVVARELPIVDAPVGRLVLRAARLFDGIGGGYRENLDIVIDAGRIAAVEPQRERPGEIVVDMGDLTALAGLIDADARLPDTIDETLGPLLLAFGVTTIVTDSPGALALNERWAGKEMPGPRVLGPDWRPDLEPLAAVAINAASLPTSPRGIRYENGRLSDTAAPVAMFSGLADSLTPQLTSLLTSRQARLTRGHPTALRRFIESPPLGATSTSVVLGSRANGLAPGVATQAELRALRAAGLNTEHVLRSAGINAAAALGLGVSLGRIAVGAGADIVIVDGNPLGDINDVLDVVGVIRNGRFFSAIGLIERVGRDRPVE